MGAAPLLNDKVYVEPQIFSFGNFTLENGESLARVDIAYETYGRLNAAKTNAILIEHAFSMDAHAAFYHAGDARPGWWDTMIGPGKAIDTEREAFFLRITGPGDYRYEGADLGILITRGRAMDDNFKLNLRARDWIRGIKKYYAGKPILTTQHEAAPEPGAFKIL